VLRLGAFVVGITAIIAVVVVTRPTKAAQRPAPICSDGFDFPVGPPNADGYYDAQPFGGPDHHLGNDWNGNGGLDTDLGDPVFATSSGIVVDATDYHGGWGNVIRIQHPCGIESLYAHLDVIGVNIGMYVKRGQQIGTIGDAHGRYRAHLHFELRDRPLPLGEGYSEFHNGWLDPTAFVRLHRPMASR
jgi:murein DD-endopeptidase MepM/ murein hydrolase activator NlpD